MTRTKTMTTQIAIKLEPSLLEKIKSYAKEHGTNVSSLMKQATIEHINRSMVSVNTLAALNKINGNGQVRKFSSKGEKHESR